MNKFILIIVLCFCININLYSQNKCKFIGYTYSISKNYNDVNYCGGRRSRQLKYGEEKITTASFYDYNLKRMIYIQKREVRSQYCYSWGYWSVSWVHNGFKDNFIENKIYYLNLKKIEYTL
jgi:hypothetical protein